jgi:beta-glucosidase-like glycosyl hydrolase
MERATLFSGYSRSPDFRHLVQEASMAAKFGRRDFGKVAAGTAALGTEVFTPASAQETSADERARATEQQMTDDERFSLLISVMGANTVNPMRDKRIPEGVAMSAGYTPGVPRLRVPALQATDASLGVTNPGYRADDKGAVALPASIVIGSSFNPALARDAAPCLDEKRACEDST